ncbi:transmembrane protein 272-like isoform X2 [Watersipora subatra]|uniref:transmembrane protein 272-like isoform X2 n=1 Tax=Watersipora subatra TaxID=2589382 RepID=UPI00355BE69C
MGTDDPEVEASQAQDSTKAENPTPESQNPNAESQGPPPPSYSSLFSVLREERECSDGVKDYAKKITSKCFNKVFGVVFIVIMVIVMVILGLALPIAEIVIGAKYVHDCPAEKYLPIYLIVSGVFIALCSFCGGGTTAARSSDDDDDSLPIGVCCNSINGVFLLAWLIAGTVWVTRMVNCEDKVTPNCFSTNDYFADYDASFYCPKLVYEFTYWDIMVKWILLGVVFLFGTFFCCMLGFAYYCIKSSDSE